MKTTLKVFLATALIVLMAGALSVSPAFASEEQPEAPPAEQTAEEPPADVPTEESAPASEGEPAAEPPAEEPVAEETPAESVTEPATEPAAESEEEQPAEEPESPDVDEPVIELSLDESAEISDTSVTIPDPIWCPASVAVPVANASGCTASFASLDDLLDHLVLNQKTVDGTIWIEKTYDSGAADAGLNFVIDGNVAFSTMSNFKLNFKGGWNGIGTGTLDSTDPSEFNGYLWIDGWKNDLTFTNLFFSGTTNSSLDVETTGNVTLTNISADGSSNFGVYIDNTSGVGNVTVSTGTFDNNGETGLEIDSNGQVTLSNVSADSNGTYGVDIDNSGAITPKNVVMTTGTFEFIDNNQSGLRVVSKGAVLLKDVRSADNSSTGVYIDNTSSPVPSAVTLSGSNEFEGNTGAGLYVLSNGPISANNIMTFGNTGSGALLDNSGSLAAQNITLTGTNLFLGNTNHGLNINSRGAVTTNRVEASGNGLYGMLITNTVSTVTSGVSLNVYNRVENNGLSGITVESNGAIVVANITANNNGTINPYGVGVSLKNQFAATPKSVTLTGTNVITGSYLENLLIFSDGAVVINNLTVTDSLTKSGAVINNTFTTPASPQNVTLIGHTVASENYENGVHITSYGVVVTNGFTASQNGISAGYGVYIDNLGGTTAKAVTMNGTNTFTQNRVSGIFVISFGAITVNNLTSTLNITNSGAEFSNAGATVPAPVTIKGYAILKDNDNDGLVIDSKGVITVYNLTATGNGTIGAELTNDFSGSTGKVILLSTLSGGCTNVGGNASIGMEINSRGAVEIAKLCADNNGSYGVQIFNHNATTFQPVKLIGTNVASDNGNTNVHIVTKGAVTISNLTANSSATGNGIYVDNTPSSAASPQNVTFTGYLAASNNNETGIRVMTYGNILAANIEANNNGDSSGDFGADLQNDSGTIVRSVTLTGENNFNDNVYGGLYVESLGLIKINNMSASGATSGVGAFLTNDFTGATGGVTLTGLNYFGGSTTGLYIISTRTISLNSVTVQGNESGAIVHNSNSTTSAGVTITGTNNFSDQTVSYGLDLDTRGTVTLNNITASNNASFGADITNDYLGSTGGVTLNGVNTFNDNGTSSFGLRVRTNGAIKANSLTAINNGDVGLDLDNSSSTAVPGITITGKQVIVSDNTSEGISLYSRGPVTVSPGIFANNNGAHGAYIYNQYNPAVPQTVTLGGTNTFTSNAQTGLVVNTYGAVVVSNLTASENGETGAILDNSIGTLPRAVTLTGFGNFESNGDNGLRIYSLGLIKAHNLFALDNGEYGIQLDNQFGAAVGGVTLSGYTGAYANGWSGLYIQSYGAVTANNVTATYNDETGVFVDTETLTTKPSPVTFTGTNVFSNNGNVVGHGLYISTDSPVVLNNVTASNNQVTGVSIDNYSPYLSSPSTTIPGIKLTGTNRFIENNGDGINFFSTGLVDLSRITAYDNGGDGIQGSTDGSMKITCALLVNNAARGLNLSAATIGLTGVFTLGNVSSNSLTGILTTVRTCPLP